MRYKSKLSVIVIGWIRKGKRADCGETMKNQLMIQKLEELGIVCRQMDFKGWKHHPWVLVQTLWNILIHKEDTIIFSTSTQNVYPMMKLMKTKGWKANTVHWVIGGNLGDKVESGTYDAGVIGYMKHTLVESNKMKEQLEIYGIKNVKQVANFKPIPYYPKISVYKEGKIKFVFVSRIMPDKGCDYIVEAAMLLNERGLSGHFSIDFYGKIADDYKKMFEKKLEALSNVEYKGFLNLCENAGYDRLAEYDIMLFPTYWRGEGFAGVLIDAFIAGLPIIATDWAHNRQFLEEGKTALFIPVHNVKSLAETMQKCIKGQVKINEMKAACQQEAEKYNVDNVVTEQLLKEIGIK